MNPKRDLIQPEDDKTKLIMGKDLQLKKNEQILERTHFTQQNGDKEPVTMGDLM